MAVELLEEATGTVQVLGTRGDVGYEEDGTVELTNGQTTGNVTFSYEKASDPDNLRFEYRYVEGEADVLVSTSDLTTTGFNFSLSIPAVTGAKLRWKVVTRDALHVTQPPTTQPRYLIATADTGAGKVTVSGLDIFVKSTSRQVIYASNEAPSDANFEGDGSEGTQAATLLQPVLNAALSQPLVLYWDIAAKLGYRGTPECLTLRAGTRIEALPNCGAMMEPQTASSYMFAADPSAAPGANGDITIIGGIWNGNGANQTNRNGLPGFGGNDRIEPGIVGAGKAMFWFNRCQRVFLRDMLIRNQMVYGILIQEWEDWAEAVNVEFRLDDDYIKAMRADPDYFEVDSPAYPLDRAMNWDGVHLLGPGGTFFYDNLRGNGDDDLLAINTNEHMGEGDSRRASAPANGYIKKVFGRGLRIGGMASIRVFGRGYIPDATPGRVDEIELIDTAGSTYGRQVWVRANDQDVDLPGATIGSIRVRGYNVTDGGANVWNRIQISNAESVRIDGVANGITLQLKDNGGLFGDAFQDEIIEGTLAAGSATSLVTGTAKNVVSITLLPGKWMITGQVGYIFDAATEVTMLACGPSTVTATLPVPDRQNNDQRPFGPAGSTGSVTQPIVQQLLIVSVDTPVYLVAKAAFSAGTLTAFGSIIARRLNESNERVEIL